MSRRGFLEFAAALSALRLLERSTRAEQPVLSQNPFALGVASGDPDSTGVVLWTRLAPAPLEPSGGMPSTAVEVKWEVSSDESFSRIVASGSQLATPQLGHSVHVELKGLEDDRWYFYRFMTGDAVSPVGRTRTMPKPDASPERLHLAVASCQNYEQGLYTAYEQMAADEPDLVFFLGDYIYEYEAGRGGKVRTHHGAEIQSLDDYRARHAQYRTDPLLQGMHGRCPWFVAWDDHEFDNNCAGDISEEAGIDPTAFLARRANSYQAYYEMMPLRMKSLPRGPHMRLYRHAAFGRLADFCILDTRQYRTDQPNGDRASPLNEAALSPDNSLLGAKQRHWLQSRLIASKGLWNVLAQQVMMSMAGFAQEDGTLRYSMDQWPGAAHERMALLDFLATRRVPNPITIAGDIHSNWVNDLRVDDRRPETPIVAAEFVATSISSGGNGADKIASHDALLANNPGVRLHNAQRGYLCCNVTPKTWTTDVVVMDNVLQPGGKASVRASFVVEAGRAGILPG